MLNSAPVLQQPVAISDDYMLLPIDAGFDWDACFAAIDTGEWYLVAFRSKHRMDVDEALLTELDLGASLAAHQTRGFLFYFVGTPRTTGECLSFCLWQDRVSARAGSSHASHRDAIDQGVKFYEYYTLERYSIQKIAGKLLFLRL